MNKHIYIIRHGQTYSTLYAHLNGFAKRARKGRRVKQGQVIGYVGQTGLATGPHLHYEFRVNGVHKNPLTVPFPRARSITADERPQFLQQSRQLLAQLDRYQTTRLAARAEP